MSCCTQPWKKQWNFSLAREKGPPTRKTRAYLQTTLREAMQRLHYRFAKKRTCFHIRTILASSTRSIRLVLVHTGRFTCRRRIISCCRRSAFSATWLLLLLARSVSVPSTSEVLQGFVQPRVEWCKIWKDLLASCFNRLRTRITTHISPLKRYVLFCQKERWHLSILSLSQVVYKRNTRQDTPSHSQSVFCQEQIFQVAITCF